MKGVLRERSTAQGGTLEGGRGRQSPSEMRRPCNRGAGCSVKANLLRLVSQPAETSTTCHLRGPNLPSPLYSLARIGRPRAPSPGVDSSMARRALITCKTELKFLRFRLRGLPESGAVGGLRGCRVNPSGETVLVEARGHPRLDSSHESRALSKKFPLEARNGGRGFALSINCHDKQTEEGDMDGSRRVIARRCGNGQQDDVGSICCAV